MNDPIADPAEIAGTPVDAQMRIAGLVTVDVYLDTTGWSARYVHAVGACDAEFVCGSDADRLSILFKAFHAMVVRDGVLPEDAHEASYFAASASISSFC